MSTSEQSSGAAAPVQKHGRLYLAMVVIAGFMIFLDTTVVVVSLQTMSDEFNSDLGSLQWVIDSYTVAIAVLLFLAGHLIDKHGAKLLLLIGISIFTIASILAAAAPTVGFLIIARVVQGAGAVVVIPGAHALISHLFPERTTRSHALALWSATSALALAVGPLVGATLIQTNGWRSLFWINVPVGLLVVVVMGTTRSETESRPTGRRMDAIGQLLFVVAVLLTLVGIIESGHWGLVDPRTLSCIGLGLAFASGVYFRRNRMGFEFDVDGRDRAALRAVLTIGFTTFATLYAVIFLVPLSDQRIHHLSLFSSALACASITVAMTIVGVTAGVLANRYRSVRVMLSGLVLQAVGLNTLALVQVDPTNGWRVAALGIFGAGVALALTPGTIALTELADRHRVGTFASMNNLARNLGAASGIAIAGLLLTAYSPFSHLDAMGATPLAVTTLATILVMVCGGIFIDLARTGRPCLASGMTNL